MSFKACLSNEEVINKLNATGMESVADLFGEVTARAKKYIKIHKQCFCIFAK